MAAGYLDIFIDQGSTYNTCITLVDVNGNSLNLQNYMIAGSLSTSYLTTNVAVPFVITTANNMAGMINLNLPYQTTANLRPIRYVYDVIALDILTSTASKVLYGTAYVNPGVTPAP